MQYKAIIEMKKGETRRIHLSYNEGEGFVDLGPIKDHIAVNDGIMPIHYGYIVDTFNKADGDNVDVLVFSSREYKTGDATEIEIIGMLVREDGDHKVLAIDGSIALSEFNDVDAPERDLILSFFGSKSKITGIENKTSALEYIAQHAAFM